MSRNGSLLVPNLLAIPAGFEFPPWPLLWYAPFPRSAWLRMTEDALRVVYPLASTADLALTARTYAPFALAQPGQR